MSWDIPTGEKCPDCGAYLIQSEGKITCSNKKCRYVEDVKS
jgi:DNA topoisomerase-1